MPFGNTITVQDRLGRPIVRDADYYRARATYYLRAARRTRSAEERHRLTAIAFEFETRARSQSSLP